ncbi:MAG: glycosyltransferase family 39 protein [Acidobacteriaceae bacterium]|nr:glycosyltransferase family 39 protein [Acidobacteriaceae bacterium]
MATAIAVLFLYFYRLGGVGVLGPDEPRYAAIGRAMAAGGDFVTPVLWGSPWFEKPPLLYWMTAAGTFTGLSPELCGRVPVTLLSLAFLGVSFWLLQREFGRSAAAISTLLLATSAAWLTYSELCLTDLPLAVFFASAAFLSLPFLRPEPTRRLIHARFVLIGVCLALASLAKGLVPLALALPFAWFLRGFWRKWWLAAVSFLVVAAPWYLIVYARNGSQFVDDFFWKHHVQRIYSTSLQHVQPWYYYIPVLLAGLFPWTPLIGLLASRNLLADNRRRFLGSLFLIGFILFSVVLNKLPGYLLPLIPSLWSLIGAQFETKPFNQLHWLWLLPCTLLISTIPLLARTLPEWLSRGKFQLLAIGFAPMHFVFLAVCLCAPFALRRSWAAALLILCVCAAGVYLKEKAYPVLDEEVSARGLWRQIETLPGAVCNAGLDRAWQFGLAFYNGSPIPDCGLRRFDFGIRARDHLRPVIERLKEKAGR